MDKDDPERQDNKDSKKAKNKGTARRDHGRHALDFSACRRIPGGMRKRTVKRVSRGGNTTRVARGGVTGVVRRARILGGTRMRITRRVGLEGEGASESSSEGRDCSEVVGDNSAGDDKGEGSIDG